MIGLCRARQVVSQICANILIFIIFPSEKETRIDLDILLVSKTWNNVWNSNESRVFWSAGFVLVLTI